MKEFINKLIERLEECQERYEDVAFAEMNENGQTLDFEYAHGKKDGVSEAIDIVNQLAEEYKPCHKLCTDCEEYDLVRNHCPKLCKVIKETVKEMEENHSGWISCSERLPSKEEYLRDDGRFVVTDGNRRYQSCYDIYERCFKTLKLFDFCEEGRVSNFETDNCVVAWQPLPGEFKQ